MQIKLCFKVDNIINNLTIILLSSFVLLTNYSWGRYVMLMCIGLIFCLQIVRDGFKYKIILDALPSIMGVFTIYTIMSAVWAVRPSDSITMGKTLFEILIMIWILYNCYYNMAYNVGVLLTCIKWSSYIISIYSLFFYGLDFLVMAMANEMRLENTYANVNTIGMLSAIGILIQLEQLVREKKWEWEGVLCVPSIFIVALTQSRKAFLCLIVGTILCLILHNFDSKSILKTIGKLVVTLFVVTILLYSITSLPVFSGMMGRMESLIASITGTGRVDNSTLVRNSMIEIGWEQFLKTPLLGMGIANPHILCDLYLGRDAYLHNNFMELLAGGGVIGFAIYYSTYAYLLTMFWRFRRYMNEEYIICLVMIIVLLMLDYGLVSYYQKLRYFYFLVFFLEIEILKKKAKKQWR